MSWLWTSLVQQKWNWTTQQTADGVNTYLDFYYQTNNRPFSVLLVGADGNGKSSFINSAYKAFTHGQGVVANAGIAGAGGVTTRHKVYTVKPDLSIWDTRGLPNREEYIGDMEYFLKWATQGYVANETDIRLPNGFKNAVCWFRQHPKIDAIIVVVSLGINPPTHVLRAVKTIKDDLDIPIVVAFTKADVKASNYVDIRTRVLQTLATEFYYELQNYCQDIIGANIADLDKPFIALFHTLLTMVVGTQFSCAFPGIK